MMLLKWVARSTGSTCLRLSHSQSWSHVHFAVCDSPKARVVTALSRLFSCSCSSGMKCLTNTDRIEVVALSCFLKFIYMYMYGPCRISLLCEPFGLLKNELTFHTRLCVTLMLCYSGYPLWDAFLVRKHSKVAFCSSVCQLLVVVVCTGLATVDEWSWVIMVTRCNSQFFLRS